ncbi:MAG: choloylglycine hydrolase family protein [Alphaproteobacteria bacterium]|nr:choloylglycine hydrolase family protein [Alphaproteobacteria bacterium]
MQRITFCATLMAIIAIMRGADACTGITLKSKDNSVVVARTVDWSGTEMNNMYAIVPRGHNMQSLLPGRQMGGLEFSALYGYAGLAVEEPEFIIDGTNEAGLSAALFYFPNYGEYKPYDEKDKDISLADFQVVSWILARFSTIDQVKSAINDVRIINIDPSASNVHWRITEPNGRQVVMEIVDGIPHFYENEIGVLTNAPGFEWQLTNLNNYVNLKPGGAGPTEFGPIELRAFGSGAGFLGLPGDFTPPSRFVRAAFLKTYSLEQNNTYDTVIRAFHILNNFDVPLGVQFAVGRAPNNMPSATQWTVATDLTNRTIYYHTMYNRSIRSINMNQIDFANIEFQYHPLDTTKRETITPVKIDLPTAK